MRGGGEEGGAGGRPVGGRGAVPGQGRVCNMGALIFMCNYTDMNDLIPTYPKYSVSNNPELHQSDNRV